MTEEEKAAISEIANSAQVLALLAAHLRRSLAIAFKDATELEAATSRVVDAVRRLLPKQEQSDVT